MSAEEIFTITDRAAERIRALLARREPPAAGIRLTTKVAGCSGFMYDIGYVDEPGPDDVAVTDKGVTLYIDRPSLPYLKGTVMDWREDRFETGFVFDNPNATALCGCGESFMVEQKAG